MAEATGGTIDDSDRRRRVVPFRYDRTGMETDMPVVGRDMDPIVETSQTTELVTFIDMWLDDNAVWLDARTIDFALDLRTMVGDPSEADDSPREPVGADA